MSDTQSVVDNTTENVATSTTVAPPHGGESPVATPAAAETAVREGETEDAPQEPKRDRRAEKRISKLTQRVETAQREAGYWRGIAEARAAQSQAEPTEGEPPKRQEKSPTEIAAARADQDLARAVVDRIREAGKDIEDFDEVMETITGDFPISRAMRDYLGEADHPAQLAQWLSENPKEAARIANMDSAVAVRAMEKQDARLKPEKKAAPNTSRASAPPPEIRGGGGAVPHSIERMSHADLLKWTAAQARK